MAVVDYLVDPRTSSAGLGVLPLLHARCYGSSAQSHAKLDGRFAKLFVATD